MYSTSPGKLEQAAASLAAAQQAGVQYRADAEQAEVPAAELTGKLGALTEEREPLRADLATAQREIGRLEQE